jgi:hypothetical protein
MVSIIMRLHRKFDEVCPSTLYSENKDKYTFLNLTSFAIFRENDHDHGLPGWFAESRMLDSDVESRTRLNSEIWGIGVLD